MKKLILCAVFISALTGLAVNLYLILIQDGLAYDRATLVANFFSYFTIQSNILVALVSGSWLFNKDVFGKYKNLFLIGTLIDITLTFIIVQLILSKLQILTGIHLFADNLVHVITPILFVGYWLVFHVKSVLSYKNMIYWAAIYGPVYVVYTLVRGLTVTPNWYPYPFINATLISYGQIAVNVVALIGVFLVIGAVFTWVNNMMAKK